MADHHVGEGLLVGIRGHNIADILALSQDGHAVGNLQHLVELMGDDDKGLAIGFHVAHDGEQLVGFLGSQHSGGLVQNKDVSAAIQNLDDFHGLLLRNRHIVDLHVGIDVEAILLADVLDFFASIVQIQLTFQTQNDILRGGKEVNQLKVLVDHTDAKVKGVLGRGNGHGLVVNVDLPLVGEVNTGEHIHQRSFSAAVFTQQR